MKKKVRVKQRRAVRARLTRRYAVGLALVLGAGLAAAAEEEPAGFEGPEEAGSNWVEFGMGGLFTSGNRAQAEGSRRQMQGAFGGISDLHFEKQIAKATTFSLDGRGLADQDDYQLGFGLKKEETYFLRFNFENARTWSNGDGGYYSPANAYYPGQGDALALDRGEFSFEGGLTLKDWPGVRFKYSHLFREGEKASTVWGATQPVLNRTAGLVPTVLDIDESRHIVELDLTHRLKKTDLGVGAVYEFGDLKNGRKISQFPGAGVAAGERKITHRESTDYDLFSVHASTETWLKPNLFFSSGFLFSDLANDTAGSRIWGDNYDVVFVPNAANGQGYTNLLSEARKHDYVLNLNLMSQPTKTLTITPSLRVQRQDWDANSAAFSTFGTTAFGVTTSAAEADALDVRERLEVRYAGITNWVFTLRGEWTQGQGEQTESGGLFNAINNPGLPLNRATEETRFFQKYSLGAKWYPLRRLSVDVGGYYKRNNYDYDHTVDSTPNNSIANRYPAYLTMQNLETYDGNARITWRPLPKVTLVGRYEYQLSFINTTPDPLSGLSEAESAELTSHIVALNASWTPWSRLYLQAGVNYVASELQTPATDYTAAVLAAQNNYWAINGNAGFVVDDRTDLNVGYTYYLADNFSDNTPVGIPFGSGAEEHGVNATLVRRLNKNLRVSLRYGYYTFTDDSAGGYRDYDAHIVYTGLQYRF